MSPDARRAAEALAADVRAVFADRLEGVIVYGRHAGDGHAPATTTTRCTRSCSCAASRWTTWTRAPAGGPRGTVAGLATPLLVDRHEFARSLDVFPLEFGAIVARHEVVAGVDPFDGVDVKPDDLRRACEVQARAHLLHLREGYLEAGGDPAAIARLVAASAAPLRALLASAARLSAAPAGEATDGTMRARVFDDVLTADGAGMPTTDPARLFPEYLAAMEALVRYVDRWSSTA
jgi:hypothetical protein